MQDLQQTLEDAADAHHTYETNVLDKRDERWTHWYTAYILGRHPTLANPQTLIKLLEQATQAVDDEDWTTFTATYIKEHLEAAE